MAESFINVNDIGFWVGDAYVEAMQLCLINEIENQKLDSIEWIMEYKNGLALQALPMIPSGMSMLIEEFLTTDERKSQLLKLIDKTMERIEISDDFVTCTNLHKMRIRAMTIIVENKEIAVKNQEEFDNIVSESWWLTGGVPNLKNGCHHSLKLLKKLINGEMNTTVSSSVGFWDY